MNKRVNYYKNLVADYSKPGLVSEKLKQELIQLGEKFITLKEEFLPEINDNYTLEQIEEENQEMKDLEYMASAGLRVLIFAKQKMGTGVDIYLLNPQKLVRETIEKTGFHYSVAIVDGDETALIGQL